MQGRNIRTARNAKQFLKALAGGATVKAACEAAGIARASAYDWRRQDDDFADRWERALEDGTDALEDEALRRALKGVRVPVVSCGRVVCYARRYSDTLLIFLLKARDPKYRDRAAVELTGRNGAALQHEVAVNRMSNEQIEAKLREMLGSRGNK